MQLCLNNQLLFCTISTYCKPIYHLRLALRQLVKQLVTHREPSLAPFSMLRAKLIILRYHRRSCGGGTRLTETVGLRAQGRSRDRCGKDGIRTLSPKGLMLMGKPTNGSINRCFLPGRETLYASILISHAAECLHTTAEHTGLTAGGKLELGDELSDN